MNHYNGRDRGDDSDVHGLHEDHIAPISDDDHHGYSVRDDNYCDDARIKNRGDDTIRPNVAGDWVDGWQAGCRAQLTCDAVPHSYEPWQLNR